MQINIIGIEPQFKVYRMLESIEGKMYIGKTKLPLHVRMSSHKSNPCLQSDKHFSNVGWNNVIVDIIDVANSDAELHKKELKCIEEHWKSKKHLLLNKNSLINQEELSSKLKEQSEKIKFPNLSKSSGFPSYYTGKRRIWDVTKDFNQFLVDNEQLIKLISPSCADFVNDCIQRFNDGTLTNDEAKEKLLDFLMNVCNKKKYVL